MIDIENLCGGPDQVAALGPYIRYLYEHIASDRWMPVVATSSYTLRQHPSLWWSWPDARRLIRSGPDGADLALVEILNEPVADHCDTIEIWSGDHIFARSIRLLRDRGKTVTVRGAPGSIASYLRHVATDICELAELSFVHSVDRRGSAA